MKIEELAIDSIIPYEFNNRVHNEEQVNRIANSIEQFGFNQPIVVDESNIVLVGHGRLFAAKKLRRAKVPVLKRDGLSETQKKAYRILDNKLQNDSAWDFNNLELELGFLEDNQFPLSEWGLDDFMNMFPEEEAEVTDDEFTPSENSETFLKIGDVIQLGRHTLSCCDCREVEFPKAVLWITDPPYGVSYVGKTQDKLTIENDNLDGDDLEAFWAEVTDHVVSFLEDGAACYSSVPAGPLHYRFLKVWCDREIFRQQLIWAKDSMVLWHSDYHFKHEPILYGWKPGKHYFTNDRTKTSLLEFARPKRSAEHPTMKPIELWAELIKNSTKQQDVVIDSFLGSGTTLIACEQLNRTCHGSEISPVYCETIIQRYKHYCERQNKAFVCSVNGQDYNPVTV